MEALKRAGISAPFELQAKEGLALVNGTAVGSAVAATVKEMRKVPIAAMHLYNVPKSWHLDSISQVYIKDLVAPGLNPEPAIHKEKKKGIFSSVLKDLKGSKTKHEPEADAEDARKSVEVFTVANFPLDAESKESHITDDDEVEILDIDDIDLGDPGDKPKGNSMMAALNKQKLTSKFQVLKGNFAGKLKQMKGKNEKVPAKEEPQDEKAGTVDQIKKKYGYTLTGEPSAANLAQNKLSENIRKLQGISMKTTEMQDTAISFSSMAKEVLRSAEHGRRSS